MGFPLLKRITQVIFIFLFLFLFRFRSSTLSLFVNINLLRGYTTSHQVRKRLYNDQLSNKFGNQINYRSNIKYCICPICCCLFHQEKHIRKKRIDLGCLHSGSFQFIRTSFSKTNRSILLPSMDLLKIHATTKYLTLDLVNKL